MFDNTDQRGSHRGEIPHLGDFTEVQVAPDDAARIRDAVGRLGDAGPMTVQEWLSEQGHILSLDEVRTVMASS